MIKMIWKKDYEDLLSNKNYLSDVQMHNHCLEIENKELRARNHTWREAALTLTWFTVMVLVIIIIKKYRG